MSFYPFAFEGFIARHGIGRARKLWYTVVFLPPEIAAALPFDTHPQLRVEGEIADLPFKGAFVSAGDGRFYVMAPKSLLKEAGLQVGDAAEVRFRVGEQDAVDLPSELAAALAEDEEAAEAWDELTPGRRRGLAHFVASAKTDQTRHRRIAAVAAAITGRAPGADIADDVRRLGRLLGRRAA